MKLIQCNPSLQLLLLFSRMLQLFYCEAPEMFCGRRHFTWIYIIRKKRWWLRSHFWVNCSFRQASDSHSNTSKWSFFEGRKMEMHSQEVSQFYELGVCTFYLTSVSKQTYSLHTLNCTSCWFVLPNIIWFHLKSNYPALCVMLPNQRYLSLCAPWI